MTSPANASLDSFWQDSLEEADPAVFGIIRSELDRQRDRIELIASENIASLSLIHI